MPSAESSASAMPGDDLIGRARLLDTVVDHILHGRSVLLVGEAGMGKSAILRSAASRTRGTSRPAIYCPDASTIKKTLQSLVAGLWERGEKVPSDIETQDVALRHQLRRWPIGQLRQSLSRALKVGPCAALLDHPKRILGPYADFVERLVEELGVPIVAATRSLAPEERRRLWWIGLNFVTLEVRPLTDDQSRRLIQACLDRAGCVLPDRQDFTRGVMARAGGSPRIITRLCRMATESRYQIAGRTDVRLLWLDWKIANLGLRDGVSVVASDADAQSDLRGGASPGSVDP